MLVLRIIMCQYGITNIKSVPVEMTIHLKQTRINKEKDRKKWDHSLYKFWILFKQTFGWDVWEKEDIT